MTTRFLAAASTCALLTACALPPKGVDAQALAKFDAAVGSIGCDLAVESDYIPVELQTGLTREQVMEVVAYKLQVQEGVQLSNGGYRSVVGSCVPTEAEAEAPAET